MNYRHAFHAGGFVDVMKHITLTRLVEYLKLYSAEQARRHEVRPGLTGLAQVKGRNAIAWEDRFRLDIEYVDNVSFRLDARILLDTVRAVLAREGITEAGHATMSKFEGVHGH